MWPGNPPFTAVQTSTVGPGVPGYAARWLGFAEHSGTHVDAPAHKIGNGVTVDRIAPADLVAPLVVISIAGKARHNPRALLTGETSQTSRTVTGGFPAGRWWRCTPGWQPSTGGPDAAGFGPDAVRMLVAEGGRCDRDRHGVGRHPRRGRRTHCHPGVGPLRRGGDGNLTSVPPLGSRVVVGAPKFAGSTGGPAPRARVDVNPMPIEGD